jgi:hypothetical protein
VSSAPDLIAPVVAFRGWKVIDDRLLSPYIPVRWEGRVMHAVCHPANRSLEFGRGWLSEPHASPHPDCRCGIYAYHRAGFPSFYGEFAWTAGIVSCWGRIEAHADGLRAEHARVEALAVHPAWGSLRAADLERIAARLGCDLAAFDELEDVAPRYGAPLPVSLRP